MKNSELGKSGILNSKFLIRNSRLPRIFAVATLIFLSCAPRVITRDAWQQMSPADKAIYVSVMMGEEKAKQQKGGSGRKYSAPPEHYVTRIDAAYAQGDRRDVAIIFQEMADLK